MANVGSSLNLTNLIEENPRQKQRKKRSCSGHTYPVQAGANNLISLCLWSLHRNRTEYNLLACVAFLIIVSYFFFFFCVCTDLKLSNSDLWLLAAPAANPHHPTFLLESSTSPFSAFSSAQAPPGIRLGSYFGQLNVISWTGEFPEAEWLCRALIPETRKGFQHIRQSEGRECPRPSAAGNWRKYSGEMSACTSLVLAFSWLFYHSLPSNRFANYISRLLVWLQK